MQKKTKKIRLMTLTEVEEHMAKCRKNNQTGSLYYQHLTSRYNQLTASKES